MKQSTIVRDISPDDKGDIIKIFHDWCGKTIDSERLSEYISSVPGAVALDRGDLVGFVFCIPRAPDIVEIGNLFVKKEYRNQGIGSTLIKHIEKIAKGKYDSFVVMNSMKYQYDRPVPDKRPAVVFYQSLGYSLLWSTDFTAILAKRV